MRLLATLQRYEYRTDLQKNAQKTTKSNLKTEKRHKNHKKRKITLTIHLKSGIIYSKSKEKPNYKGDMENDRV